MPEVETGRIKCGVRIYVKALWNLIFGSVVGASAIALIIMLALSLVATDIAFGLAALWLLPLSACLGLFVGGQLQGYVDWEQPRPRSLRHWFVGGAAAAILLCLTCLIIQTVQEGYRLSDINSRLFQLLVIPSVLCSFAGVIGGSVGLVPGALVHGVRRRNIKAR